MATDLSFVEFIVDQLEGAGLVTYKKMFGEYALYCNGKVVALVCGNQFFVKPTPGGRTFAGNVSEAAAYPGAKLSFLIGEKLEDREWIRKLIRITAQELPAPQPKIVKQKRKSP